MDSKSAVSRVIRATGIASVVTALAVSPAYVPRGEGMNSPLSHESEQLFPMENAPRTTTKKPPSKKPHKKKESPSKPKPKSPSNNG